MKGLEIAFQLNNERDFDVVPALANLTGNYFKNEEKMDITWRIFHVTLGDQKYFRVLYRGDKINDFHPEIKKKIREYFDKLAHLNFEQLMELYNKSKESNGFNIINIKEITEEYDLWQDKLWNYI
ncbi:MULTISPECIES: DUF2004 domain-containing protein [Acidiplasma]|jgi:hypothetical protein|uniref:DUF2004 domain-containing protein n=1 Tax=Acidiplasma cupricumulans TaxID=312540 RepID=A0A0Q0WHX2_9ARCH|nr:MULTISPECIES: DUF2004 domain-containing protein [Acidiplasma]KJE48833.1 hypothetical protein TZ01_05980 [Acidiplasma sp. MBA-1]KQB35138.1 hypothetical protein AOG55_07525 [Acidiplasma cupricumulans]WMT54228.1 MAG: DUF2004 domain-containing protein [Acidiplasma sp.]